MKPFFTSIFGIILFALFCSFYDFKNDEVYSPIDKIESWINENDFNAIYDYIKTDNFHNIYKKLDCHEKGKISHLIGKVYYIDNQNLVAIEYFKKAVEVEWKNCNSTSKKEMSNTIYNIGISYKYTDQMIFGKKYIDSAMFIIEGIVDYPKDEIALKYQGAGSYFAEIGDFTKSETYLRNAINESKYLDEIDAYYIHIDLLSLYLKFKKYTLAKDLIKTIDSKFIVANMSLLHVDYAIYLLNCAEVFLKTNNAPKAEELCSEAIKLLDKRDIDLLSNAYEIMGVIYYRKKEFDRSKMYYEKAFNLRLDEKNIIQANLAKSYSLENLAELELAKNNYAKSLMNVNAAIALNSIGLTLDTNENPNLNSVEINSGYHLLRQLSLKEKILFSQFNKTNASNLITECLNLHFKIDTLINNVLSSASLDQSKLELIDIIANHSSQAIDVSLRLYEQNKNEKYLSYAFYFSCRSKAILLQKLIHDNTYLFSNLNDTEINEYIKLSNDLNDVQRNLHENILNRDSLMKLFSSIQIKFDQFTNQHLEVNNLQSNSIDKELFLDEIISKVKEKRLILDIFSGNEFYTFFAITKNGIEFNQKPRNLIDSSLIALKSQCKVPTKDYDVTLAHHLYKEIFDFLPKDVLRNLESLVVIPHNLFHGFPMETLVDGEGDYIIKKWNVSYSYTAFGFKNPSHSKKYKVDFTGFATNYTNSLNSHLTKKGIDTTKLNLNRLAKANEELELCSSGYTGNKFYNSAANIDNFYQFGLDSKILYFSLHSIVDKEDGGNSLLVFDDNHDKFLLRSNDLITQHISNELVVLSACHTADGKLHSGEGLDGITRSFLAAGAESVLSSLWAASENSSLEIIPFFLQHYIENNNSAISLRDAKLSYLQNTAPSLKHPYYWSNYIIISNVLEDKTGNNYFDFILGTILLITIIIGLSIFIIYKVKVRKLTKKSNLEN